MEKININIAELLRDCPKDMELDCMMYEDVYFDYVDELNIIHCYIQHGTHKTSITFNQHGTPNSDIKSKCVIFPKGKTTWKGFHRPFRDGDIVTWEDRGSLIAFIYKERKNVAVVKHHFALYTGDLGILTDGEISLVESEIVFATEEEKQKLFDSIKANGYKWNADTKTLEKLPIFKVGNKIRLKKNHNYIYTITGIREKENKYECGVTFVLKFSEQDDWELVPNKFKVGDRVRRILDSRLGIIVQIDDKGYYINCLNNNGSSYISFTLEKDYELVPDKFDISKLKPFEDKVLVRNAENQRWVPAFWGYKDVDGFITTFGWCKYCIPYEGNEHLWKTNNDCDDYFKTWQE